MVNKNEIYRDYLNELTSEYVKNGNSLRNTSRIAAKHRVTRIPSDIFFYFSLNEKPNGVDLQLAESVRKAVLEREKERKKDKKPTMTSSEPTLFTSSDSTLSTKFLRETRGVDYIRAWVEGNNFYVAFCDYGKHYSHIARFECGTLVDFSAKSGVTPDDDKLYKFEYWFELKNIISAIKNHYVKTVEVYKNTVDCYSSENDILISQNKNLKELLNKTVDELETIKRSIFYKLYKFFNK